MKRRSTDKAAFNPSLLKHHDLCDQKLYPFRPPWRGRLASWRSTPSSWCLSMTNTRFSILLDTCIMKNRSTELLCVFKPPSVQADDLAGKVYGVNSGLASLDDPDSGGTGRGIPHFKTKTAFMTGDPGSVIELKAVLPCSPGQPDVSNSVQEAGWVPVSFSNESSYLVCLTITMISVTVHGTCLTCLLV